MKNVIITGSANGVCKGNLNISKEIIEEWIR